jgi:hypothetical protein
MTFLSLDEEMQEGYCRSCLTEKYEMKDTKYPINVGMVSYGEKPGKMNKAILPSIILLTSIISFIQVTTAESLASTTSTDTTTDISWEKRNPSNSHHSRPWKTDSIRNGLRSLKESREAPHYETDDYDWNGK